MDAVEPPSTGIRSTVAADGISPKVCDRVHNRTAGIRSTVAADGISVRSVAGATAGLSAGAAAALVSVSVEGDGLVLCPFRIITGGAYCAGCGVTRAVGHLMLGDLAQSWAMHPMALILGVQLLIFGAFYLYALHSGLTAVIRKINWNRLVMANGVLLVLIWCVRAANGSIPTVW